MLTHSAGGRRDIDGEYDESRIHVPAAPTRVRLKLPGVEALSLGCRAETSIVSRGRVTRGDQTYAVTEPRNVVEVEAELGPDHVRAIVGCLRELGAIP